MVAETCTHLERSSRRFAARVGVAVWLRRSGYPRFAVAFAIVLSAVVGLGCSIVLHRWGLTTMGCRYPLAMVTAYITFLAVVGMWVARAARRVENWERQIRREAIRRQQHNSDVDPELGDWIDAAVDTVDDAQTDIDDPQAIPGAFMLLFAGTIVLVCAYFVWTAPAFLAELLVEGALVAWLYQPPARESPPHWFPIAVERTAAPALMMAFCAAFIGFGFQFYVPEATTLAEVLQYIAAR